MKDYITALYERFQVETQELSALMARTNAAEERLKETLDTKQRKLLLRMIDCQNDYRQEAALCGFLSGWRVANGLRDEMDAFPHFSIADEDERKAMERFSGKENEKKT